MEHPQSLFAYRFSFDTYHINPNKNELIAFTLRYLEDINNVKGINFDSFLATLSVIDEYDDDFWLLLFQITVPVLYKKFSKWRPHSYVELFMEMVMNDFKNDILPDIGAGSFERIVHFKEFYPEFHRYFTKFMPKPLRSTSPAFYPQI